MKRLKLHRNKTLFNSYEESMESLNNSTFLENKDDGEFVASRFNDKSGTPRSLLGVVSTKGNTKYVETIDMYELDGGYYDVNKWKRSQEQKILVNIPGSIYFYDTQTDDKFLVKPTEDLATKYPLERYTPIGILVVPMNHNVYGDGSAAIMSLKEMNSSNPDEGSVTYEKIFWGKDRVSSLMNYSTVANYGRASSIKNNVGFSQSYVSLPSDSFFGGKSSILNPYDTDTAYNTTQYVAPSPYNEDDSRNVDYFAIPPSSLNSLSDFNGIENTNILIGLSTYQEMWDIDDSVINEYQSNHYPAACCCWRYHTDGTYRGDWYLPACGELGYIMPKFNTINNSIATLINSYGSDVGTFLHTGSTTIDEYYWSSTQRTGSTINTVSTYDGRVGNHSKNNSCYVRAFYRIGSIN